MERVCETPAGIASPRVTPQAQVLRGRTVRGKRVPGVEINVQIAQTPKKPNSIFIEFVYSLRKGSFQRSFSLVKEPLEKKKLQ
ncbi:hypothetical protein COF64_20585 [Bacillus sp. AFS043905]|nr:hypothetical protein COF64_20585 [Bacillus sp. AFS043905]